MTKEILLICPHDYKSALSYYEYAYIIRAGDYKYYIN